MHPARTETRLNPLFRGLVMMHSQAKRPVLRNRYVKKMKNFTQLRLLFWLKPSQQRKQVRTVDLA
jgi:hypothetical protein